MAFPVSFDVERPPAFQRAHVFLRVGVLVVIGWLAHPFGLLWLGLPLVAAIFVGAIVWLIAVAFVLVGKRYPESLRGFLLGLVRWEAFLLAYLASLVDQYPPFALETASASSTAPTSS